MITPCGQARRTVCQPQPASTRSSRAEPGARPRRCRSRGRRGRARRPRGRAAEPGVVRGAPVVEPGAREVHDPAARRAQPLEPLLLVAVRPHDRLVERPDPLDRRAAHGEVGPPDHLGLAVRRPEVERRDRRLLAPAAARRPPSKRARIGPPKASASGWRRAPSTRASSQPVGASMSSSTNATSGARPRARRCCARRSGCAARRGAPAHAEALGHLRVASVAPSSTTRSSYAARVRWRQSESSAPRGSRRPRVGTTTVTAGASMR